MAKRDTSTLPIQADYCSRCGRPALRRESRVCAVCGGRLFFWQPKIEPTPPILDPLIPPSLDELIPDPPNA